MSPPRLYLDDASMINRDDEDHLSTAAELERVLGAFSGADYCILHNSWILPPGFPRRHCRAPQHVYSTGDELRRLMRLIGSVTAEEMRNRIEFLDKLNETVQYC